MKNKKLIKKLSKFNPDSEIVITGCYGSETDDILSIEELYRNKVDVFTHDKTSEKIIIISTDICSG